MRNVKQICFVAICAVLSRFTRFCVEKKLKKKNWRKYTNIRYDQGLYNTNSLSVRGFLADIYFATFLIALFV